MKRVDLITRLSIITLLPLVFVHAVVAQPSDGRLEDQTKKETNIVRVDNLEVSAPNPAERDASKLIGKEASLKLKDLSGVEQSLDSLKGRIVILNFWATYCIPCRTEMPWLVALQDEFAAHGVQVIGASANTAADRDKVLQFVKDYKINFPIWLGATTAATARFGLGASLPATVLIGKDGRIVRTFSGVINHADLKKKIESMLSTPAVTNEEAPPNVALSVPLVASSKDHSSSSVGPRTSRALPTQIGPWDSKAIILQEAHEDVRGPTEELEWF